MKGVAFIPVYYYGELHDYAKIDAADAAIVAEYRWNLVGEGYAYATIAGKGTPMHRFILGMTPGVGICHHVNEEKLDNRRANLEIYETRSQANSAPHPKRDEAGRVGLREWLDRRAA